MSSFSDEPVLVKPTARSDWKRWLAIVVALGITGCVIYIPINKSLMAERAHDAKRGPRDGSLYPITVEGRSQAIELTWSRGGQFAPTLDPVPAPGVTLRLSCRAGEEVLKWNTELGCFGPTTFGGIDPYNHYKLSLRLEREGQVLWRDTLWAYGHHDSHGHSH